MVIKFTCKFSKRISPANAELFLKEIFNIENNREHNDEEYIFLKSLSKWNSNIKILWGNKIKHEMDDTFSFLCKITVDEDSNYEELILEFYDILRKGAKKLNSNIMINKFNRTVCKPSNTIRIYPIIPSQNMEYDDSLSFEYTYLKPNLKNYFLVLGLKILILIAVLSLCLHYFSNQQDFSFNVGMTIFGTVLGLIPTNKLNKGSFNLKLKDTIAETQKFNDSRTNRVTEAYKTNKPNNLLLRGEKK